MKITLASVSLKRSNSTGSAAELTQFYVERAARYKPCVWRLFLSEAKLLDFVAENSTRTRPVLLLADSRGQQLSSDEFAAAIGSLEGTGIQQLVVAIGPADGWSAVALGEASRTIAFGRITLPHQLAAVVAAEQIYRALTIRAGHPYHSGH